MPFRVLLTESTLSDLEEIGDYIDRHDVPGRAEYVMDKIEEVLGSLTDNPQRGAFPPELLALGIRDYREVFFRPYRCIYRVTAKNVYVQLTADGRRDMQSLLQRRLLGSS
ncbi:type II toxin-antitoxin system RelE/ParE family toxin [Microbulbifer litoralis]|uniref:type II toxin-antitoxin system RelE/ParE family toxin n=1 Tax=Microbulbifer litoralis TaxID=2933965 RepID=UPI00202770B1|nr:type II toxin-antitoxin system RelE/ParE family toxin [Microbulbifer sp. GX H0434]